MQRDRFLRQPVRGDPTEVVDSVLKDEGGLDAPLCELLIKELGKTGNLLACHVYGEGVCVRTRWCLLGDLRAPAGACLLVPIATASDLAVTPPPSADAALATATAKWLFTARPQVGKSALCLDAALGAAAITNFKPDVALQFYELRAANNLPPSLHAANMAITACSHSGEIDKAIEVCVCGGGGGGVGLLHAAHVFSCGAHARCVCVQPANPTYV